MTEPTPTVESLLDKIIEGTRNLLQYMRNRFLWTWLSIAVLAILTGFSLWLATRTAQTNLKQTDDIARVANTTADSAAKQADQTTAYLKGEQGIPGVPGENGQDGTPGQPSSKPGPQGPPGPDGSKGDPGEAGANGTPGATGPTGLPGAAGPLGPVGLAGATGTNGTNGEAGPSGAKGEKGDKGNQGDVGPQGPAGPAGPQGPPGPLPTVTTSTVLAASANDTSPQKVVTANCTSGKISGGGYAILPADPNIVATASTPSGTTGWSVTVNAQPSVTAPWQVLAFATCVIAS
jgi:cell division protein FtsB